MSGVLKEALVKHLTIALTIQVVWPPTMQCARSCVLSELGDKTYQYY